MITIGVVIVIALGHAKPVNAFAVLAFILGAAFASWFMPQLRIGGSRHGQSLSDVAIILSLMVLPWPWAILAIAIGTPTGKLLARFQPGRVAFNSAKEVITVCVAAAAGGLSDLQSPFQATAETLGRIVIVALIAIATDEAISVPALALGTGQRARDIWAAYAPVRISTAIVRMGCGIATGYLLHYDVRLAIAMPVIAIALHLAYANRLQQRVDRLAWARLSQLVDVLSTGDSQTVRLAAVHGTAELFACAEVDLVLHGTGSDLLIRGDARTISYVGSTASAPDHVGSTVVAKLGGNGAHDSPSVGELRLRFLTPIKLTDQEQHTLQALAAALGTAVRKANSVSAAARLANDRAHASTKDPLTGLANRWFLLDRGLATVRARAAGRSGTGMPSDAGRPTRDGTAAVGGATDGSDVAGTRDESAAAGDGNRNEPAAGEPPASGEAISAGENKAGEAPADLVGLAVVNLREFLQINDALGPHVGDQVLVAVAERLAACGRAGDLIARLSTAEFAALLTPVDSTADALSRTRDLLVAIAQPLTVDGIRLDIAATAGVAVDGAECDVGELLRRADVAAAQATVEGQPIATYAPTRDTADVMRLALGADLTRAVARREFTIAFQPIVELESGMIRSAEALARWQHPQLGQLSPHQFLDGIERSGLLVGFTQEILDQALAGAREWADAGFEVPVAVNVSPRSLLDAGFPDLIAAALDRYHLTPGSLIIELTETLMLSQLDVVDEVLHTLRELGVMLALDDFGTGFSSLATVARVPVDELKIDRSFISGLAGATEGAIVRSTIELGRSLGIVVVAEGIESTEQRDRLWALGCNAGQGHLFSRAIPADRLIGRMRRGHDGVPGRLAAPLQVGDVIRLPPHRRQAEGGSRDELS